MCKNSNNNNQEIFIVYSNRQLDKKLFKTLFLNLTQKNIDNYQIQTLYINSSNQDKRYFSKDKKLKNILYNSKEQLMKFQKELTKNIVIVYKNGLNQKNKAFKKQKKIFNQVQAEQNRQ